MGRGTTVGRAVAAAVLLGCAAIGCRSGPGEPSSDGDSLALAPCRLGAPGVSDRVAARCGRLAVPEDPSRPDGRRIELFVAVVPAISRRPARDPLVLLAGGPGQAATEAYVYAAPALERIRRQRDIVLVDQRGTGRSAALTCRLPESTQDFAAYGTQALKEALRTCLRAVDADPRMYGTAQAVSDLDLVLSALGRDRMNLLGSSYGTRVALEFMRRHPSRVRTAVLDGVVAPEVALGESTASDAQRALDAILERCRSDDNCRAAFPDTRTELDAVLSRLERTPTTITVNHPLSGLPTEITAGRELVASALRFLSYSSQTAALIPLLVHEAAAHGNDGLLAAQLLATGEQLNQAISLGMHMSVVCAEDVPFYGAREIERAAEGAYLGRLVPDALAAACEVWPAARPPADFKQPVTSTAPVLLLSGEADPVTPPGSAERVAAHLAHARHIVAPGQGHGVLGAGCIPDLVARFVEDASASGLDTSCVARLEASPFFLTPSGPVPHPIAPGPENPP